MEQRLYQIDISLTEDDGEPALIVHVSNSDIVRQLYEESDYYKEIHEILVDDVNTVGANYLTNLKIMEKKVDAQKEMS